MPKEDDSRHVFDILDSGHRPYTVAVTALIESPMKMYVENQNYSSVLFGSKDKELVKNIVRFEAKAKWFDFFKVLPVDNKMNLEWKITDFNNILYENPYFS